MYKLDSWGGFSLSKAEQTTGDEAETLSDEKNNNNDITVIKGNHLIYEANVKVLTKTASNFAKTASNFVVPVAAMTGSVSNGHSANGHIQNGTAATEKGCWTIGLVNSKFKYLSAETFGYKINANGKALKKKQVWILEPSGDGDTIVMRSHLNKYVAVDQFGNVTCDQVIYMDNKDMVARHGLYLPMLFCPNKHRVK